MIRRPVKRTKYARRKRDLNYMAWIRTLPCICCDTRFWIEAAHVGPKAFGRKCPDRQTLPLCRSHHRTGPHSHHQLGRKFWSFWNLDRNLLITQMNAAYDRRFQEAA